MAEILDFVDGKGKTENPDLVAQNEALADFVWTCGKCGNSTFQLVRGGKCRCAHCNTYSTVVGHYETKASST